jgi:hypothetical protein
MVRFTNADGSLVLYSSDEPTFFPKRVREQIEREYTSLYPEFPDSEHAGEKMLSAVLSDTDQFVHVPPDGTDKGGSRVDARMRACRSVANIPDVNVVFRVRCARDSDLRLSCITEGDILTLRECRSRPAKRRRTVQPPDDYDDVSNSDVYCITVLQRYDGLASFYQQLAYGNGPIPVHGSERNVEYRHSAESDATLNGYVVCTRPWQWV